MSAAIAVLVNDGAFTIRAVEASEKLWGAMY